MPSLALIIFMAILPMILLALSKQQGIEAKSWQEGSVLVKFFYFQIFNVFFVTTLAGGLLTSAEELADDPTRCVSS